LLLTSATAGSGAYEFALPLALPTGAYYVTVTSSRTPAISGRGPATGFVSVVAGGEEWPCTPASWCLLVL